MHFPFPSHVRTMHRSSYFPWLYQSAVRRGGQSWISSWSAIILSSFLSRSPSYAHTCPFSISFFNTPIVWSCCSRSMIEGNFAVIQYNGQRHGCVYKCVQVFTLRKVICAKGTPFQKTLQLLRTMDINIFN